MKHEVINYEIPFEDVFGIKTQEGCFWIPGNEGYWVEISKYGVYVYPYYDFNPNNFSDFESFIKKEGAGGLYDEIASVYNRNSQINIDIKDI